MISEIVDRSASRILFVVNEDWAFNSHFLDRALAAKKNGFVVGLVTRCTKDAKAIEDFGITVFPINSSRRGLNPLREVMVVLRLAIIYRRFRPDILHHVALKPIVVGTIASFLLRDVQVVNAPIGMGYIYSSTDTRARVIRPIITFILKQLLGARRSHVIIENSDDYKQLVDKGFVKVGNISLIRGAGVDLNRFKQTTEPSARMVVTLIARMLRDKGIEEFAESASLLKNEFPDAIFRLVGDVDNGNPASLSSWRLRELQASGAIEWLGRRDDIPEIIGQSNIVCLPSYREGLPKTLIEAAAVGRALVATDVPGCREVVKHGVNGLLVPPRDPVALAKALELLMLNPEMRTRMGVESRKRAEAEFGSDLINQQTLQVYASVLTR